MNASQNRFSFAVHFAVILCGPVPLAIASAFLANSASHATPITFAFDAHVTNVAIFPPFNLPFPVAVGDTIHGQFSFEPYPAGNFGVQQMPLRLDIAKTILESSAIEMSQLLNQPPPYFNGSAPNLDYGMLTDLIGVQCPLTGCSPNSVPGSAATRWDATLTFDGPSPILSNHLNLTGDVDVWNALPLRGLVVNLSSEQGGARIDALAGPLTSTPEPSSATLAVLAASVLQLLNVGRSRSHTPSFSAALRSLDHDHADFISCKTLLPT
jgi:hypothetical protein